MSRLHNDTIKRGLALTLSTLLNDRKFENEFVEYLESCGYEDARWTFSFQVSEISPTQTMLRVQTDNGGPRYFNVKLAEVM